MTSSIDSVSPTMTLRDFSEHMLKHKHLGYPVMENNQVLGMITINELHKVEKEKHESILVKDVMRKDVFSISSDEPAVSAFKLMMKNNHERIIVQKDGKYVGIISWSDLLRAITMRGV
jgi:predicted transcriptional regulator